MNSFEEHNVGLEDLAEDSDEDREIRRASVNGMNGQYNRLKGVDR